MRTMKCVWKHYTHTHIWQSKDLKALSFKSLGKWIYKDKTVNLSLCSKVKNTLFHTWANACLITLQTEEMRSTELLSICLPGSLYKPTLCRRIWQYLNMHWRKAQKILRPVSIYSYFTPTDFWSHKTDYHIRRCRYATMHRKPLHSPWH